MKMIQLIIFTLIGLILIKSVNADTNIFTGLKAYYPGDSSTNYSDVTRNQPDGFKINNPVWNNSGGAFNSPYYNFSSVTQTKINLGAGFKEAYTSMTWGAWMNQDKNLADCFPFDGHNGANQGFFIRYNTATATADCVIGGGGSEALAQTSITNDVWQHITCVWNGTGVQVWKNGVFVAGTPKTTYTVNSGNTSIGSYPGAALHFNGGIDNAYFYNRALNASEIALLNNSRYPFYGINIINPVFNVSNISANQGVRLIVNVSDEVNNLDSVWAEITNASGAKSNNTLTAIQRIDPQVAIYNFAFDVANEFTNNYTAGTGWSHATASQYAKGADAIANTNLTLNRVFDLTGYLSCSLSARLYINTTVDSGEFVCMDYQNVTGSTWYPGAGGDGAIGGQCQDGGGSLDTRDAWRNVTVNFTGTMPTQLKVKFRAFNTGTGTEEVGVDDVYISCQTNTRVINTYEFNYTSTATEGKYSIFWIYANNSYGMVNRTYYPNLNFTVNTAGACVQSSSVYCSGDWTINCADNPVISTSYDLGGNSIIVTGTGGNVWFTSPQYRVKDRINKQCNVLWKNS